jgi:WD40 repeat protein
MKQVVAVLFLIGCITASAPAETQVSARQGRADYEKIKTLKSFSGDVLSVAFSPDGKVIAAGTNGKAVVIWEVATWKTVTILDDYHGGKVTTVAFSHDGKLLASGDSGGEIFLWDTNTWTKARKIFASNSVNALAFSPDGGMLAIASDDTEAVLQDLSKDSRRKTALDDHSRKVLSIAFSPDGAHLATGSNDNTVVLWNAASGKKLNVLKGHMSNVETVTSVRTESSSRRETTTTLSCSGMGRPESMRTR